MNTSRFSWLFMLACLFWGGSHLPVDSELSSWKVRIAPSSCLSLVGTTNVNSFECGAKQDFGRVWLETIHQEGTKVVGFKGAGLILDVCSLDCGHSVMNRDLQNTLKADQYPDIKLELLQVKLPTDPNGLQSGSWQKLIAEIGLSLAGSNCTEWIFVEFRQTRPQHFRVIGNHALAFSDFNLKRPTAVMGLVKVDDIVQIDFDLHLSLQKQ